MWTYCRDTGDSIMCKVSVRVSHNRLLMLKVTYGREGMAHTIHAPVPHVTVKFIVTFT